MVAGAGASANGFESTNYGSLTPATINGLAVTDLRHITASDTFQIRITGADLGAGFFGHCSFRSTDSNWDGVVAQTSEADYSYSGTQMVWNWTAPFSSAGFINGVVYDMEII